MHVAFNALTRDSSVNHRFSCDASDLGLKPGQWPMRIALHGCPYGCQTLPCTEADLEGTHTYSDGTITVRIYND